MKKNNIIAAVAALTLAFTACQNDDNLTGDNTGKTPIELNFSASATTRAISDNFELSNQVGVFFANADDATLNDITGDRANHLYTLTGEGWNTEILYWDDLGTAAKTSLDLYGYYPYNATAAPLNTAGKAIAWTSPVDQSTAEKLTSADLLLSNNVKAYTKATADVPTLNFTHTMAKLRINLVDNSPETETETNADTYTKAELAAATAIVKGLNTTCEVAFVGNTKTVTGADNKADITPMTATAAAATDTEPAQATAFEAIVVPQAVAANDLLASITIKSNETNRTYSVKAGADGFDLQQGKLNTITVTITKSGVNVNMTVTDWVAGTGEKKDVIIDGINSGTAGTNDINATAGDEMKLFYVHATDMNKSIATTYTYGSDGKWTAKDNANLYWDAIALDGYNQKFTASYTPGAAAIAAATTPENDLLQATATPAYGAPINLKFEHAMAQLTINLIAGTGYTDADLIDTKMKKQLTVKKSIAQNFDAPNGAWSITFGAAAPMDFLSGTTYTLAPQTLTDANTIVLTIANGNTYTVKLADIKKADGNSVFANSKIDAAQSYTLNLTVNNTEVTTSATVADWTTITGSGDMETEN